MALSYDCRRVLAVILWRLLEVAEMLVMCTDFGPGGPYTGQVHALLVREAPDVPVISLFDDLPAGRVQSAAYLLPAYTDEFPLDSVFLCVVDPGVGIDKRLPLIMRAEGRWFVGPDNGLFAVIARRARLVFLWRITYQPERLSASFHGRDLFAPVAAQLARGEAVPGEKIPASEMDTTTWPDDLAEIIYIDPFGNAMTGIRASSSQESRWLSLADGDQMPRAKTFGELARGQAFYYTNANGLLEIAVNRGNAAQILGITVGDKVKLG